MAQAGPPTVIRSPNSSSACGGSGSTRAPRHRAAPPCSAAPPLRRTLDETATAELSAGAGGLVLPVFRGVTRADAALQLVMDASSSMRVWDRMFAELEQVFSRLGAFWDIQVSHLHAGPGG